MLLILPEFEDFFGKIFIFSRADVTYNDLSLYFYLYYSHLLSHTDSFLLTFFACTFSIFSV